jgi:hypothetical protein
MTFGKPSQISASQIEQIGSSCNSQTGDAVNQLKQLLCAQSMQYSQSTLKLKKETALATF